MNQLLSFKCLVYNCFLDAELVKFINAIVMDIARKLKEKVREKLQYWYLSSKIPLRRIGLSDLPSLLPR